MTDKEQKSAEVTQTHSAVEQKSTEVQALSAAPAGWKLVPVEPTNDMQKAADEWAAKGFDWPKAVYRAMLAAAPTPPAEQQAMTVIDAEQWEPCSPSWIARGGDCAAAPRVWNAATCNHWHPKAAPKAAPGEPVGIPHDKLAELHEGLAAAMQDGPARNLHIETAAALRKTAPQQEAHHLTQALTDPENQPNQYGVEFGMSGPNMHFKIGNQLFRLAYEPDDREEFEFMKSMLISAFSTFTPDVKAAPQQEAQEPCGWAVYDSLGFYELHDTEAEAKSFCDHYNKRPIDPKKPYTYRAHFTAPQPAPAPLSRDQIRAVFMAHGFTIKEGQADLKQYVYDAAEELLRAAKANRSKGV